jgi:hypothetical protein
MCILKDRYSYSPGTWGRPWGVCQNGGTTGGTQVACNLGGLRGLVVGRGLGTIKIMNTATLALYYLTPTAQVILEGSSAMVGTAGY